MIKLLEHECAKKILLAAMNITAGNLKNDKVTPTDYCVYQDLAVCTRTEIAKTKIVVSEATYSLMVRYLYGETQKEISESLNRPQAKISTMLIDIVELLGVIQPRIAKRWPSLSGISACKNAVDLRKLFSTNTVSALELVNALKAGL